MALQLIASFSLRGARWQPARFGAAQGDRINSTFCRNKKGHALRNSSSPLTKAKAIFLRKVRKPTLGGASQRFRFLTTLNQVLVARSGNRCPMSIRMPKLPSPINRQGAKLEDSR